MCIFGGGGGYSCRFVEICLTSFIVKCWQDDPGQKRRKSDNINTNWCVRCCVVWLKDTACDCICVCVLLPLNIFVLY